MTSIYSFPASGDCIIGGNGECMKEDGNNINLCEVYENYPFFDSSGYANPNLIGATVLLTENDNSGQLYALYDHFCPYNMFAVYSAKTDNGDVHLCNNLRMCNNKITHQIVNDGEMTASGKHLFDILNTYSSISETFNVEYIKEGFSAITEIGDEAFLNSNLVNIRLPYCESGLTIGNSAFKGSTKLEKFFNYHTIKSVGDSAFEGCTSLIGDEISCQDKIALVGKYDYENTLTRFSLSDASGGTYSYGDFDDLTNTLKVCFDCGTNSFKGCSNITSLVFYDTTKKYTRNNAYYYHQCYDNYESRNSMISGDTSNKTPYPIYYGENGQYSGQYIIGEGAFADCISLSGINGYNVYSEPDSNVYWTNCGYRTKSGQNIFIPESIYLSGTSINSSGATGVFSGCTSLSGTLCFENPDKTGIPPYAFYGCSGITGLSGGTKINCEFIGDNAFSGTTITDPRSELAKIASGDINNHINRIFGL